MTTASDMATYRQKTVYIPLPYFTVHALLPTCTYYIYVHVNGLSFIIEREGLTSAKVSQHSA
jgi:hypothetical protein